MPPVPSLERRTLLGLIGAGALLGLTRHQEAPPTRPPRRSDRLPDLALLDQRGATRQLYSELIADQVVLVSFFYTHCEGSCPGTQQVMRRLRADLSPYIPKLRLLSLSLDPARDTPEAMATHASLTGIDDAPGLAPWVLLTGTIEQMEQARVSFGYRDPDPAVDSVRSNHAALITYGDDAADRWGALPSGFAYAQLLRALQRALVPSNLASVAR